MSRFKNYTALEKIVTMSLSIDPLKKMFDPDGTFKLRFAENDIRGFEEWVEEAGWKPHIAIRHAVIIEDDEVFGKALEFPCRIV